MWHQMFDGCRISHSGRLEPWLAGWLSSSVLRTEPRPSRTERFVAHPLVALCRKTNKFMFHRKRIDEFRFLVPEKQRKSSRKGGFTRQKSPDVTVLTALRLLKRFLQHPAVGVGL